MKQSLKERRPKAGVSVDIKLAVVSQFGEGQSKAIAGVGLCKAQGNLNANEAQAMRLCLKLGQR